MKAGTTKGGGAMTFREIGESLGISTQAANQIYNRAIGKLRRRFKRDGASLLASLDRERSQAERAARDEAALERLNRLTAV